MSFSSFLGRSGCNRMLNSKHSGIRKKSYIGDKMPPKCNHLSFSLFRTFDSCITIIIACTDEWFGEPYITKEVVWTIFWVRRWISPWYTGFDNMEICKIGESCFELGCKVREGRYRIFHAHVYIQVRSLNIRKHGCETCLEMVSKARSWCQSFPLQQHLRRLSLLPMQIGIYFQRIHRIHLSVCWIHPGWTDQSDNHLHHESLHHQILLCVQHWKRQSHIVGCIPWSPLLWVAVDGDLV